MKKVVAELKACSPISARLFSAAAKTSYVIGFKGGRLWKTLLKI
jgi:hypothetical protein